MIDNIKRTIASKYHLRREKRRWLVDDIEIQAQDQHSFGFTLDKPDSPPFAFLGSSPPAHVAKMCDAIIAVSDGETLYVFSIEKKTQNKDDYRKQLTNGKLFCDWLFSLYREHKHHSGELVHIGLLIGNCVAKSAKLPISRLLSPAAPTGSAAPTPPASAPDSRS